MLCKKRMPHVCLFLAFSRMVPVSASANFFYGICPYRPRKTRMLGCRSTTMIWATARHTMMQSCGFTNRYAPFFGSSMCKRCCYPPLFPCCTTPPSHLFLLELRSRTSVSLASSATFRSFFCFRKVKMSMVDRCARSLVSRRGRAAISVRSGAISSEAAMLTWHFQRKKRLLRP